MESKSSTPTATQNWPMILIDTSVLLVDPEVLARVVLNKGLPFITDTILSELDYNKTNSDHTVSRNARTIFKIFANESSVPIETLPNGSTAQAKDSFRQLAFNASPVFVVTRRQYTRGSNNDARIIEVARDYGMRIITRDQGLKVRAECEGVGADIWTGPRQSVAARTHRATPLANTREPSLRAFEIPNSLNAAKDEPLVVSTIPREGNVVRAGSRGPVQLLRTLSSGGEGTIYRTDRPGFVCKIYHRDRITALRRRKVELMLTRSVNRDGICWPVDTALNEAREFVGFFMPEAEGRPIQTSMFVKPVLEKSFPNWRRRDLTNLCLAFLGHVEFLHSLNVLIGDINPLNLLVTSDSNKIWLVDTDSFQIEGFPCPVGTVNFTAPEIQGKDYSTFLRTKNDELFAVATMLFMILHPGKPPFAQQGGGDPGENIRNGNFAYPLGENSPGNAPEGPWRRIWSNLPYRMKDAFTRAFKHGERISVAEWRDVLLEYRERLELKQFSNELFPAGMKVLDPVEVECGKCGKTVVASRKRVESLASVGKPYFCGPCHGAVRLEMLARQSRANQPGAGRSQIGGAHFTRVQGNSSRASQPSKSQSASNPRSSGSLLDWVIGLFK